MPQDHKALDAIVGKTIERVHVQAASDELSIELHFTDGTSISILNGSFATFELLYAFGPADEQVIKGQIKGRR
jgi:hypothetical protein